MDSSLDLAAEEIDDIRSRDHFEEVLSSYTVGNYRSCVVMLWSVLIADLIYKLQALRDIYQDDTATAILQLVEKKQRDNPNNPEWELYLLDQVNNRMHLLEAADYQHLENLQKLRHLSAHPVITNTTELFSPNKETARATMRNALEATLLKPPILSKQVTQEFVTDLARNKHLLPDQGTLWTYLESKYFRNMHPVVERELIRALWKFCFRLSNPDTDSNRDINVRALSLLHDRDVRSFMDVVIEDPIYFSEIASEGDAIEELVVFLAQYPRLFDDLTDAAKVFLDNFARQHASLFVCATFLSENVREHIEQVGGLTYTDRRDILRINWNCYVQQPKKLVPYKISTRWELRLT